MSISYLSHKINSQIASRWICIFLLGLLLWGGLLRFYHLSDQSYWMDEGYTINAVLSVTEHGSTILDSGQNYPCLTYCYPTALLTKIFGGSPTVYRLFSAIIGLAFIILIFFITKRLFNRKAALLSSFLITFSYLQIAWSRQARFYTLYFFYKFLYSDKNKYSNFSLTLIFTLLASFTYPLGYLLFFIFLGWILIDQIFIQKKFNWKKILIVFLVEIIILLITTILTGINLLTLFPVKPQLFYILPYYLSFYLRTYWLFMPLVILAFFKKDNPYKKEITFLLFVLGLYLIFFSFFTNIVNYRYLFHLTPIIFILGSIGFLNILDDIKFRFGKVSFGLIIFSLFVLTNGVFIPQSHYYLEADDQSKLASRPYYVYTPQPNWTKAYNFIKENKKEKDLIISSQPVFNKIFLKEAGYWIKYNYLGLKTKNDYLDQEYYVGAKVINNLSELQTLTIANHGFIIFDYMSIQSRISEDILNYIQKNLTLIFQEETNSYSKIWIYKF